LATSTSSSCAPLRPNASSSLPTDRMMSCWFLGSLSKIAFDIISGSSMNQ
jgi:hypothetical protein